MKNLAPETIRLMQAALDARDWLRRLAASIDAAGDDPGRLGEVLQQARAVCLSHADLLRGALKDSAARWHSPRVRGWPRWLQDKNPAGL